MAKTGFNGLVKRIFRKVLPFVATLTIASPAFSRNGGKLNSTEISHYNQISKEAFQERLQEPIFFENGKIIAPDVSLFERVEYFSGSDGQKSARVFFKNGGYREIKESREANKLGKTSDSDFKRLPADGVRKNYVLYHVGSNEDRFLTASNALETALLENGGVKNLKVLRGDNSTRENFINALAEYNGVIDEDDEFNLIWASHGNGAYTKEIENSFSGRKRYLGWSGVPILTTNDTSNPNYDYDSKEKEACVRALYSGGLSGKNIGLEEKAIFWDYGGVNWDEIIAFGVRYSPMNTDSERVGIKMEKSYLSFDEGRDGKMKTDEEMDRFYGVVYFGDSPDSAFTEEVFETTPDAGKYSVINVGIKGTDHIFAVKTKDGYRVAGSLDLPLDKKPDYNNLEIHCLDTDNKGLFDVIDANKDGDFEDYLSYQGELYFADGTHINDYELGNLLKWIGGNHYFGTCFAGEMLDNDYGEKIAAYAICPSWNISAGNYFEANLTKALEKNSNGYLALDNSPLDGGVSFGESIKHVFSVDPTSSWCPELQENLNLHYYMQFNCDGNKTPSFVKDLNNGGSDAERMNEFYMLRDYRNSTSAINSLAVGAEGSKILLAYPNPFNSTCTIPYSSERTGEGGVSIYDSKGGLVKKLLEGRMNAGKNSVQWNGTDGRERKVSSGAYIIKIRTPDNKIESRKIIFVK